MQTFGGMCMQDKPCSVHTQELKHLPTPSGCDECIADRLNYPGKVRYAQPQEDYDGPDNCKECNEDWIADIITDAYEEHFVDGWIGIAAAKIRKVLKKQI